MADRNHDLPAVRRRLNYLRQELYTYDRFLRNPTESQDMAHQAKWAIDSADHQAEIEELEYLLDLAKGKEGIDVWRRDTFIVLAVGIVSIVLAAINLFGWLQ